MKLKMYRLGALRHKKQDLELTKWGLEIGRTKNTETETCLKLMLNPLEFHSFNEAL